MCGICGFTGMADRELLRAMTARLRHRGPDSEGFHFGDAAWLGMRRLAIIGLAGGDQPIYNEDGKVAVVCNGEIYNFRELRAELQAKGHVFKTATDTEVIVHLYEELGEDCPLRLEGMFAFAVADERTGKLLLARDHMGIKPLYYGRTPNGGLIFASEMKSLLLARFIKREIDPEALDLYLSYLYIPEPLSIFSGIAKLPPGRLISHDWRAGRTEIRRYWKLRKLPHAPPAGRQREEALRELLARTVKSHLMSDVPLGVFLSGGLDSGAITAFMAQAGAAVKTFSIGYEGGREASYDELDGAALTARRYGAVHTEIRVAPDIAGLLPKIAWHFDEPHADSSALVTYLLSQRASASIKVALTGIGGDELFGGYPRYLGARLHSLYRRVPGPLRRAALRAAERLGESGASRDWANWGKRFARGGLLNEFAGYDSWVSAADAGLRSRLYSADWRGARTPPADAAGRREIYLDAGSQDAVDRASYLDLNTYLPGDLLMMADKMSMANSLELRVPFCDRRLVEFMYSLPAGERAGWSGLKVLLRRVLRPLLPPEILARRKQGFMVPLPIWLKDKLAPLCDDLLSAQTLRRRGYFNPDAVARLIAEHRSGARNRADLIWALMVFETWHRLYADG